MQDVAILYDNDCGFCRWTIARLLSWDRQKTLRPVALQDEEAVRLLPGMSRAERMRSWHVVTADGHVWSAGGAVGPLLRQMPFGRIAAPIPEAFPKTTERLYRWGAHHRDRLGKMVGSNACSVDPKSRRGSGPF
ncbi:MAG: hypothetical protein QOI81_418 [Actinomycetota bacterium]|jgi:predicted DCC family thiol-disulfide oxidoreductase YuxK|nr:hypothetical protein [Actinomycetota bacterium]